jgi:hypothetical protein
MAPITDQQARTRAFARLMGPYMTIVPTIIAPFATAMRALANAFFSSDPAVWFAGAD